MKQQHVPVSAPQSREKQHRMTAAILSIILQGLGQLYNRQWIKGICLLLLEGQVLLTCFPACRRPYGEYGHWGKYAAFCQSEWVYGASAGRPFNLLLLEGIIVLLVFCVHHSLHPEHP